MPRRAPARVSRQDIDVALRRLNRWLGRLATVYETMEEREIEAIEVEYAAGLEHAPKRLESFCRSAEKGLDDAAGNGPRAR